jgi:myo-inositol-1(or 4)-monophosphatase
MNDLNKYFKIAEEINGEVADFLLSKFGSIKEITHKTDSHYGIPEDLESNNMYEDFLKTKTPEVALYTEEGEKNLNSDYVWVIDPIEGTSNYRAGNPFWATQIALIYKNEPIIGIVYAPFLKQKFHAIKGSGAHLNGNKINCSDLSDLNKALVDMGRGMKDEDKDWFSLTLAKLIKKIRTNRIFGACGLDISYCAAGMTDAFLNSGTQIYDVMAGLLIAREAGAKVLNFEGNDWSINDKTFLVSNELLAKDILKIIS